VCAASSFNEDSVKTKTFYRRQQQQLVQMWTDVTGGHHCLRRCDIAMVIAIFTGQNRLK